MPNVSETYGQALYALTKDLNEKDAEKAIGRFVALLKRRNELYLAPKALAACEKAARKDEGLVSVRFDAPDEVPEAMKEKISASLARSLKAPVEIDWRIDPSLIGGAVLRYADVLLDASVKGKLARLKQQLI